MGSPPEATRFTDVRRLATTVSTNADVLELGRAGEAEGVVVVADTQTGGRGRHGRTWEAPPGSGLLFSVLLRPSAGVVDLVTATAALAVQDAAADTGAVGVGIKWPNDLVVEDAAVAGVDTARERKLVGILAEADWTVGSSPSAGSRTPSPGERVLVALGIGVNLTGADGLAPEVLERRVALGDLVASPVDADDLLSRILGHLEQWYARLTVDRDAVLDTWRARCVTLGRAVRVDLGPSDLVGTAIDLDAAGRLLVRDAAGEVRAVAAGDVVHLRPAPGH